MKIMQKRLLVVESPTKAKTITKYLNAGKNGWQVVATVGHLRDLPKGKMGVDLAADFAVDYVIDSEKKKVVNELKKKAKEADEVYLATDPDREGEAIAWHVETIINDQLRITNRETKQKIQRVSFHEITKEAVEEAIKDPREIDMDLVDAQQGRRVLDRLVGYSLSPVLWKKVRRGLSAGRVQSVAVRLIVEREREIEKFGVEKYFKIGAEVKGGFQADLVKVDGKSVNKTEKIKLFDGDYSVGKTIYVDRNEVDKFVNSLGKELLVEKVAGRETTRTPLPPLTTSKMQQLAARRWGWSGKQTMRIAQRLYEKGLITYHRTDSVNLSSKAIGDFRDYIRSKFGEEYLSSKERVFKNYSKNAQEAHEAIRPTSASRVLVEGDAKEQKLYQVIWNRAVATQAAGAKLKTTTVDLTTKGALFRASGIRMLFDGFLKITGEKFEEQSLPELKEKAMVEVKKYGVEEAATMPPPRYSEASLVAALEKQGIGRPSTYAPIISTIQLRQYVDKDEGKFKPTTLGMAVTEYLTKNFEKIMSLPFTADMEGELDEVAKGETNWKQMMRDFWQGFEKEVKTAEKESERVKVAAEKLGEKCPECKTGELVIRLGRFGKFVSCERFPECKYTRAFKELGGFKCPECGAEGVVRKTKTGRRFYGCSNYPKCKWAGWKKP